jgi:hypothetical protein
MDEVRQLAGWSSGNPSLSKALYTAWGTVFNTGGVDHSLKEIIRVQLSRAASCNY